MIKINNVVECFIRGGKIFIEESRYKDSYHFVKNQLVSSSLKRICLNVELRGADLPQQEIKYAPIFCVARNSAEINEYSSKLDDFIYGTESEYSEKIRLTLYETYTYKKEVDSNSDLHKRLDFQNMFWLDLNNGIFFMLDDRLQDYLFNKWSRSCNERLREVSLV